MQSLQDKIEIELLELKCNIHSCHGDTVPTIPVMGTLFLLFLSWGLRSYCSCHGGSVPTVQALLLLSCHGGTASTVPVMNDYVCASAVPMFITT